MVRIHWQMIAVIFCCSMTSCTDGGPDESTNHPPPISDTTPGTTKPPSAVSPDKSVDESPLIDGLWSGTWGGGIPNTRGIVFQPVISQLLVEGDHVELDNFHHWRRLQGTVRFDKAGKKMVLTTSGTNADQSTPKVVSFAYDITYNIQSVELTLSDDDGHAVSFQRLHTAQLPLADVQVELLEATGITKTGDLLVNAFTQLRAGPNGSVYYRPTKRSLKTSKATVRLLEESGWKDMSIAEAGRRIRKPMPVVIAYKDDDVPAPNRDNALWTETGSPQPDSEAVWHTLASTLRAGTLVFVLSSRENVPQP